MCWSRSELETWITSPTVRPHLRLWYHLCIINGRRFNDAIDWINTGATGYFYNTNDLEDDLLLICLGEGNGVPEDGRHYSVFADSAALTGEWLTQELWARSTWRIVQANQGPGQVFETMAYEHAAAAYSFVIDLLCISFHSVAFRGKQSCYERLINGCDGAPCGVASCKEITNDASDICDHSVSSSSSCASSSETSDDSMDSDFEPENANTTSGTSKSSAYAKEPEVSNLTN